MGWFRNVIYCYVCNLCSGVNYMIDEVEWLKLKQKESYRMYCDLRNRIDKLEIDLAELTKRYTRDSKDSWYMVAEMGKEINKIRE